MDLLTVWIVGLLAFPVCGPLFWIFYRGQTLLDMPVNGWTILKICSVSVIPCIGFAMLAYGLVMWIALAAVWLMNQWGRLYG